MTSMMSTVKSLTPSVKAPLLTEVGTHLPNNGNYLCSFISTYHQPEWTSTHQHTTEDE
jgi:hypothetical protein